MNNLKRCLLIRDTDFFCFCFCFWNEKRVWVLGCSSDPFVVLSMFGLVSI